MRVSAGSRKETANGGWLHVLDPDRPVAVLPPRAETPPPDWTEPTLERHRETPRRWLADLAASLGVTVEALDRQRVFRIVNAPWRGCAGWPMSWSTGQVVGVRVRTAEGRKVAIHGSRNGLFLPSGPVPADGPIVVCEGNTDAAAVLSVGIYAIGRPSCVGCEHEVAALLRGRDSVAVLADADGPGLEGAKALATLLTLHVGDVVLAAPPAPFKDVRDWIRAGATRDDVLDLVGTREPLRWGGV
jgi:hypothetical protein